MKHKISSIVLCNVFIEASCDILSKYPLIMEIPFDAILYSKLGNEISDASHIKCSPGPHLARRPQVGPTLADAGPNANLGAGPNARPRRGVPLSSDFMTSSCSVNRVTIVVERRYTVQH